MPPTKVPADFTGFTWPAANTSCSLGSPVGLRVNPHEGSQPGREGAGPLVLVHVVYVDGVLIALSLDVEALVAVNRLLPGISERSEIYRTATEGRFVAADGELDGEDILPGFRCRLSNLLD